LALRDRAALADPAWFVDPNWNPLQRARVANYLRTASVPWAAGGLSWCRFRCGVRALGSAEHTDGVFHWPEGLVHYVESHNVRLPAEFTQHVLDHESPKNAELSFETPIDTDWWLAQRGFGDGKSFRSPPPVGNFVAQFRGVTPGANVLAALRAFPSAQQFSVPELRERILQGRSLVLLQFADESPRPTGLEALEQLGISIEFQPLDSQAAG
jgi:hypothetical protein